VNNDEACETMFLATRAMLGQENVGLADKIMAAEDFSFMANTAPGCFIRLGTHNPSWDQHYFVHTPTLRIDEDALPVGTASLVASALEWMKKRG
jgi:amidohydrolase